MGKNKKFADVKTDKLIDKLKEYPFETVEHNEVKMELEERISDKYKSQFVLCTLSKYMTHRDNSENIASKEGVTRFSELKDYLSSKLSFFEDGEFKFIARNVAEWNLSLKQINVFGFITDGTKFILLKKIDNDEITMVGGHTDFTQEAYNMSQVEYLKLNMQRELDEEIKHGGKIKVTSNPVALVNTYERFHDLFHMTLVYKIDVDDVDALFKNITTGEKNKHTVVKFDSIEDVFKQKRYHSWLKPMDEYLKPEPKSNVQVIKVAQPTPVLH